jgi:hypothetical protein
MTVRPGRAITYYSWAGSISITVDICHVSPKSIIDGLMTHQPTRQPENIIGRIGLNGTGLSDIGHAHIWQLRILVIKLSTRLSSTETTHSPLRLIRVGSVL